MILLDSMSIFWSIVKEEVDRWSHVHHCQLASVDLWHDDLCLGVEQEVGVLGMVLDEVGNPLEGLLGHH